MKIAVVLGALCIFLTLASAGKQKQKDYRFETNEDLEYGLQEEEHNAKKYAKNHKHHHKHHIPLDKQHSKTFGKHHEKELQQQKKQKPVTKTASREIPVHEAGIQADVKENKNHLKDQQIKHQQEELLQDVAYESKPQEEVPEVKSPHQYQRGHHKAKHHFTHDQTPKHAKENVQAEEKLFPDHNANEQVHKSILEDSFETLNDAKHSKKANKHKKAYQKGKKEIKDKKNKKNKKDKKDKKEKW